jgi:hypothetical protein
MAAVPSPRPINMTPVSEQFFLEQDSTDSETTHTDGTPGDNGTPNSAPQQSALVENPETDAGPAAVETGSPSNAELIKKSDVEFTEVNTVDSPAGSMSPPSSSATTEETSLASGNLPAAFTGAAGGC